MLLVKSYQKKCGGRNRFSLYLYCFKKSGKRGVGGWSSERGRIFEKNIPGHCEMLNLLFDGLSYNTIRNLAHCSYLSSFLLGSEKH